MSGINQISDIVETPLYTLDVVKQLDPQTLENLTKSNLPNGDNSLIYDIAYEILNYERFVVFPDESDIDRLYFGKYGNYVLVDEDFINNNLNKLTSYELMTLKEVASKTYDELETYLEKSYYLINTKIYEYIFISKIDNETEEKILEDYMTFIEFVKNIWINNGTDNQNIIIVIKPSKYMNRFYTDKTEFYVKLLQNEIPNELATNLEFKNLRTLRDTENDEEFLNQYPLIGKYKNLPTFILIDINFIIPVLFNPNDNKELNYDKDSRIVWRRELLQEYSNPNDNEKIFFEKISKIKYFLGIRDLVTIIDEDLNKY